MCIVLFSTYPAYVVPSMGYRLAHTATTPQPQLLYVPPESFPSRTTAPNSNSGVLLPLDVSFCVKTKNENMKFQADGATAFVLDTSKITVGTVTVDGQRARWVQHRRHSIYGSALDIRLPGAETGALYAKGQLLQVRAHTCA